MRRGYDAISVAYRDDDGLSGHDDLDHRGQYLGWIDDTYLRWLGDDGLEVIWDRFIPEGDGGHVLVLARKPEE